MDGLEAMYWGAAAPAALAAAVLAYLFVAPGRIQSPIRGSRGQRRLEARQGTLFALLEPLLELVAAHVAKRSFPREAVEARLVQGGDFLGISADEFVALRLVSFLAGGVAALAILLQTGSSFLALLTTGVGAVAPSMMLSDAVARRRKAIVRALPGAIDLTAMCMSAGMDFPGALSQVASNIAHRNSPMREEFERILRELSLGQTRKQALEAFSQRVDADAVSELTSAVVLAEAKGTPLNRVLAAQAESLRTRRSVMAEEAAARAGVLMMIPMMLMFGCIALLLMGPLILRASQGGF